VKTMKAGERILLGIPLDPDQMDRADWEDLPGIGPKLARKIVEDRQIYGDFHTAEAIRRVPGMGEGKFNAIKKYFKLL
jgi:competence protein ComEA